MKHINKLHDDLVIAIDLKCATGPFNLTAFNHVEFYVYTTNSNNYVLCSYDSSVPAAQQYVNITRNGDDWFINIPQADLATLDNGIIKVRVEYSINDSSFDDGLYDGSDYIALDAYLDDRTDNTQSLPLPPNCC